MTCSPRTAKAALQPAFNGTRVYRRGSLLNLTSMWHATGRLPEQRPATWLALPDTQRVIGCLRAIPAATRLGILADLVGLPGLRAIDPDLLFVSTRHHGRQTWAHWSLALLYAEYLDPGFHAWCLEVMPPLAHHSGSVPNDTVPWRLVQYFDDQFAGLRARLDVLDRHAGDLLLLVVSARELVMGERRAFTGSSQALLRQVIRLPPFEGRCPCCGTTPVLDADGRPTRDAQFDHAFYKALNRPELGWLICGACHYDLTYGDYRLRFSKIAVFRRFQDAVMAFKRAHRRANQPQA